MNKSLALMLSVLVVAPAQAWCQDFDAETALRKSQERRATIEWAMGYMREKALNDRFSGPPLSHEESRKLDAACDLLGEFHAPEAVRIGFMGIGQRTHSIRFVLNLSDLLEPFPDFPCLRMLIEIGQPSVSYLIGNMKVAWYKGEMDAPHKNMLRLYAYVLRQIDGDEVGLFRLQQALKEFKGPNKPQVQEIIEIYKLRESGAEVRKKIFEPELLPEAPQPK